MCFPLRLPTSTSGWVILIILIILIANIIIIIIAVFYIKGEFCPHYFITTLILINCQNHEEQHSEDPKEHDDQEDAEDAEQQKTIDTNQFGEDFERPQVTIESSATSPNDDHAFIKMGIQFVKAVRKSDWKLVDDYKLKLENYFQQNVFSRSQKAALWSQLTSKLWGFCVEVNSRQ